MNLITLDQAKKICGYDDNAATLFCWASVLFCLGGAFIVVQGSMTSYDRIHNVVIFIFGIATIICAIIALLMSSNCARANRLQRIISAINHQSPQLTIRVFQSEGYFYIYLCAAIAGAFRLGSTIEMEMMSVRLSDSEMLALQTLVINQQNEPTQPRSNQTSPLS